MFNDTSSLLSHLTTRRSGKPRDLGAPGPSDAELDRIVAIATRTPDHGKIAPWRFVIVPADRRAAFAELIVRAFRTSKPGATQAEVDNAAQFATQAPALVVAISAPDATHKVPVWEQELSAGAAVMNLLHAVHAHGYAGGWLTGWPAYDATVRAAFAGEGERIAGFVFIGTPTRALEERPRPDPARVATRWQG